MYEDDAGGGRVLLTIRDDIADFATVGEVLEASVRPFVSPGDVELLDMHGDVARLSAKWNEVAWGMEPRRYRVRENWRMRTQAYEAARKKANDTYPNLSGLALVEGAPAHLLITFATVADRGTFTPREINTRYGAIELRTTPQQRTGGLLSRWW